MKRVSPEQTLVESYVRGWLSSDADLILSTLHNDIIGSESNGPVSRGIAAVQQWIADWIGQGFQVVKWDILSMYSGESAVFFEWSFGYRAPWGERSFLGASVVETKEQRIIHVREYRKTG